jgi:dolichol-phosphate mannosyltransferase
MQNTPLLSLIVPTYNERENLPLLAERIHKSLNNYDYEILIVDDDSPDGTAQLAQTLAEIYPIKVICRKGERGLASAVIAGFDHARGEVLGVIDADLQHPPEMIPELLREMQAGLEVVIASRYIPGGGVEGWHLSRKIISKGATALARILLPSIRRVKDPLSGFFLLKRKVIQDVKLKPIGYKILLEVLAKGRVNKVKEVPYTFKQRIWGKSSLDLREEVNYLEHVFTLASEEKEIRRFLKFCLVGLSGVGVNIGIFWLLTRIAGLSESYNLVAVIPGIVASIQSNFILNDIWTFRDRRYGSMRARVPKFNLVSAVPAAIQLGMFGGLTQILEMYDLWALLLAIVVATLWNFSLNFLWTWRKGESQRTPASPQ